MSGLHIITGTNNYVSGNAVYDLSSWSTNPHVYGVFIGGGSTTHLYNNYVSEPVIPGVNHEFNVAGMPAGLYVVKVIADDFVETIKLVRTR
ncbi:MAG: hypothetical protein NTW16_15435 [Bacteroidetes bacterium]|nr:hypothetical protein [Bacteroidota bacterium]